MRVREREREGEIARISAGGAFLQSVAFGKRQHPLRQDGSRKGCWQGPVGDNRGEEKIR